jgi:hypothetical protein
LSLLPIVLTDWNIYSKMFLSSSSFLTKRTYYCTSRHLFLTFRYPHKSAVTSSKQHIFSEINYLFPWLCKLKMCVQDMRLLWL